MAGIIDGIEQHGNQRLDRPTIVQEHLSIAAVMSEIAESFVAGHTEFRTELPGCYGLPGEFRSALTIGCEGYIIGIEIEEGRGQLNTS